MAEPQVQYYYGNLEAYNSLVELSSVDENAIYVITDAQRMYKGSTLIGSNNVRTVDELPEATAAFAGVIYVTHGEDGSIVLSMLDETGESFETLLNTSSISTEANQVKLSAPITLSLSGQNLGGVTDGTTFEKGTSVQKVLESLMRKEEAAAISRQPSASVSINPGQNVECGTQITPTVTTSFDKGTYKFGPDTGVTVTGFTLKQKNGGLGEETLIDNEGAIRQYTAEAPVTVEEGNYTFTAQVTHSAGVAANSSFGTPNEGVKIAQGTKTATKTVVGQRQLFYVSDTASDKAEDSASVRGLASKKLGPTKGMKFDVTIPQGAKRVIIAYPASLGDLSAVVQDSTSMSALGSFTKATVSVEGANAYKAVNYNVYTYVTEAAFNADTFHVTI